MIYIDTIRTTQTGMTLKILNYIAKCMLIVGVDFESEIY